MEPPNRPESRRLFDGVDLALVGALGFAIRLALILEFPGIHGGDSVARLAHSDRLVLAYQLPLPQLLVVVTRALDPDPFWTRVVFALVGAALPMAAAWAFRPLLGTDAARIGAVLLALHPLLIHYSTVPYQESPMILFLALGAGALLRGHTGWGGLFMGLACLCRYEAWMAAALAAFAHRGRPLRALALFGWAPAAWIAFWGGLSPAGTYVLDFDALSGLGSRLLFILSKTREYSGDGLLLVAAAGAWLLGGRRDRRIAWGVAYLALFLVVVVAAGHEFPVGSGRVSERLAHIPATALCLLAGLAFARAFGPGPGSTAAAALLAAILGLGGAWHATWLAATANADPSLRLAMDVARFADRLLEPGERLRVVAPRIPPEVLAQHLRRIGGKSGDAQAASELLRDMSRRGLDGDRIAAHLPRPPSTVRGPDESGSLCATFDAGQRLAPKAGALEIRFVAGQRMVVLSRCPNGPPQ